MIKNDWMEVIKKIKNPYDESIDTVIFKEMIEHDDEYFNDKYETNKKYGKISDNNSKQFEEFAKIAMRELVECNQADFVLLKNDKLRVWWQQVVKEELAEQARLDAIARKKMLKEQALSKLSDEEKEALGLTKGKR